MVNFLKHYAEKKSKIVVSALALLMFFAALIVYQLLQ
jgi:hypothetical protein